jgi:hypothetical protein
VVQDSIVAPIRNAGQILMMTREGIVETFDFHFPLLRVSFVLSFYMDNLYATKNRNHNEKISGNLFSESYE